MAQARKIAVFYTDAGGGHRATAQALQAVLNRNRHFETVLCNPYRQLIGDIDLFPRLTKYSNEEVYNRFVLGKGWSNIFCLLYYGLTIANIKLGTRKSVQRFLAYWQKEAPDLVISVMPLANQGIYRSVQAYTQKSPVPFLVVMTDLDEKQKHVWFPKEQDYYIVCGSKKSYGQALAKPHPEKFTFHVSGLPVNPAFYEQPVVDVAAERLQQGLRPDWPTGCMMYGTGGSPRMIQLARVLRQVDLQCQMIFLCGRNQGLAEQLTAMDLPYPHLIRNYTSRVPYYFGLSDFLVCKPGPGTISEARVSGLSLLVDRQNVLPQEQYNITWIDEQKAGLSFGNPGEFLMAVRRLADLAGDTECRNLPSTTPENRAVFEISAIIHTILEGL